MKKLALSLAAAASLSVSLPVALAGGDNPAEDNMVVSNNCSRPVHVTLESGVHIEAATLAAGDSVQFNTVNGKRYSIQILDTVPAYPTDWLNDIAHDVDLNIVQGGMFNGFCVFE